MLPALVSIFLDYKCNFSCSHCSVGSSPKTSFPMPEEVLDRALEQIASIKSVKTVVFTGGEATLRRELLLEGIRRASELGYRTRLVTNVWWAKTEEKAVAYLKTLKEAGLSEFNTSFDDYRLPFIGFEKVVNAVKAARKVGFPMGIGVIRGKDAQWDEDRVKKVLAEELGIEQKDLSRWVTIIADYPTPSGTGEDLDMSGCDAGEKLDLGCLEILKTLSIHPNGSVKACCGHVMFYAKDLSLGNLMKEELSTIVGRAQRNVLYWWIHMSGPKRILERLGVEGTYASQCHACQILTTRHRDAVMEYLRENKNEIMRDEVLLSSGFKKLFLYVSRERERISDRLATLAQADG